MLGSVAVEKVISALHFSSKSRTDRIEKSPKMLGGNLPYHRYKRGLLVTSLWLCTGPPPYIALNDKRRLSAILRSELMSGGIYSYKLSVMNF